MAHENAGTTGAGRPMDRRSRLSTALPGLAGCGLLAVAASPRRNSGLAPLIDPQWPGDLVNARWLALFAATLLATLVGLNLLRYWPHLLLAAAVLGLPALTGELANRYGTSVSLTLAAAALPLALVGVLACAQALVREGTAGWGAAVAGAAVGAQVFGTVLVGPRVIVAPPPLPAWHLVLTLVGLAGAAFAVAHRPRGDGRAEPAGRGWPRLRLVLAGTLVTGVALVPVVLTRTRVSGLLAVDDVAPVRLATVALVSLGIAVGCAALAGVWSLAGALTASTLQVGLAAPMVLVVFTLLGHPAQSLVAAVAGAALGAAVAVSRWRVPVAVGLAVLCAVVLAVVFAATTGRPEKLIEQRATVPVPILLVLVVLLAATGTALVGGTAPLLARTAAVPAVLGPITGALLLGGKQLLEVTSVGGGGVSDASVFSPLRHLGTSAALFLIAGAALAGLRFAEVLAARRAERRHTEQVRREAAEAERARLARPIHDGVLQVLALMQRHGPELGPRGVELAELAGVQEAALRALITGTSTDAHGAADLRHLVAGLTSPAVTLAVPADPIMLPGPVALEVRAAIVAALQNVERHAGPTAHAWVLLEREPGGLRVTVRDDGCGIPPGRLDEAEAAGRIGVAQSIRGRIADVGGATTITTAPTAGTEVELWIPD